jgi:hypothetical protein
MYVRFHKIARISANHGHFDWRLGDLGFLHDGSIGEARHERDGSHGGRSLNAGSVADGRR